MGSIDDISQLCRLCLVKDQVNIPIFNETSDIEQIFVKINSCLPVKVSRDDNLPKKICDGCSYKLDMLYIFRNTSLDSEKQLIQWLDEAGLNSAPSEQTEVDPLANPLTSTKPEIMVKQETIEPSESRGEGDNSEICMDAQNYIIQQQKLPYEQDFDFGEPSGSSAGLMTDEPAPKRAKRTAAIKKAPLETVEDDLDAAMQITKAEEEDSDEVDQPDYVEPSTSADDQPGPSGVGKPAVEAPNNEMNKSETFEAKKGHRCRACQAFFATPSLLRQHRKKFHEPYSCAFCGEGFFDKVKLMFHAKEHAQDNKYICGDCGEEFDSYFALAYHKTVHKVVTKTCPFCGEVVQGLESFSKHRQQHELDKITCDICNKFVTRSYLEKHRKSQHDDNYELPEIQCTLCQKTFRSETGLKLHVKRLHEGLCFMCELCGKVIYCKSSFESHLRIHAGEKRFICDLCGKSFVKLSTLKIHIRVHTREKPHVCQLCGKRYSQRSPLALHLRIAHSKERPYECAACPKVFATKSLLNTHLKVHSKRAV